MKNTLPTSLILFVMIGILTPAFAEVPQQPQFRDYAHLLKRSPFTIKVNKVVKRATEKKKPANYFLRGVTKFGDKWTAIIFERNKPKENIVSPHLIQNFSHNSITQVTGPIQQRVYSVPHSTGLLFENQDRFTSVT